MRVLFDQPTDLSRQQCHQTRGIDHAEFTLICKSFNPIGLAYLPVLSAGGP